MYFSFPLSVSSCLNLNVLAGAIAAVWGSWEKGQENQRAFDPDTEPLAELTLKLLTQTLSYRTKIHSCLFNPLYCSLSNSWTQFQTHTIIPLYFKKGFDHHASLYIIVFSKAIGIVYLPSGKCSMNVSWMNSREFKFSPTNNLIFLQCLTLPFFWTQAVTFFFESEKYNGSNL